MKNWIEKNKILIIFALIILIFVEIGCILYSLFGHQLIEAMYKGKSVEFLNRFIEGQKGYPLEWYFRRADKEFKKICIFGLIATFLFGLWIQRITKRRILITTLLFMGLLVFNTIFNAIRIDLLSFENSAKRLLRKTKIVSKKAQIFNEKDVLMKLGMNSINGFYYRFDEHIKEAYCENKDLGNYKMQKDSGGVSFEFNGNDIIKLKPKKGRFILEDGLLKFKYSKDDYLQSIGDLDIAKDNIGEIEIRIKLKKGGKVKLGFSKDSSAMWENMIEERNIITIKTVPDNIFHIYRINAKNVLRRYFDYGDVIRKMFLLPSNVPNDEIEIDYIRFILKKEKYAEKLYGETYETVNKEMRKVLYTHTPLCLKYALNIPEDKPFLKFGIGILEEGDPVRFKVMVKYENTQKEVFSKEVVNVNEWHDTKIDFSEWSGKNVEILFQVEGEKGNIAFWSNPIIYAPPKERFNVIIVLEDALRADHMSCYGYFRETTPVKDKFIKEGILFLNAFSQESITRISCPSIMTSLYPTATSGWNLTEILNDRYLTLAEIMRNQGFATASFIQNGIAGPWAGLHQGFNNLFDMEIIGYRAEEIYGEELYGWIEANMDKNFFLYLHLRDPHGAYDPPKPFDSWYKETLIRKTPAISRTRYDPEWVKTPTLEGRRALYDGEIQYNDFYFKKFLEKLKGYKLLNDTLIIFIADHGEYLGEHEYWSHHLPGYIQVLHVPLLMVYPKKLPKDMRIPQPVQLIDIMPTILDLANIDKSNLLIEGDSLVSLIYGKKLNFWNNRLSISEEIVYKNADDKNEWASIFYKNWHIINSNKLHSGLSKLISDRKFYEIFFTAKVFDYFKDKKEEHCLKSFLFDIFFKYKIKCFLQKFQKDNMLIWKGLTRDTEKVIKYDPEELEHLRALGYL